MSQPSINFESRAAKTALVIGEALIDLVEEAGAEEVRAYPGGSPMNVALTLGRLGREVELVTWYARDNWGEMIDAHLDESHVSISDFSVNAKETSTAAARLDESGAATYTFNIEWNPPAPIKIAPSVAFVHTGSIAAVLEPGAEATLTAFKEARSHAITSYDPNIRPNLMTDRERTIRLVEEYVANADVIKASDEDIAWLYPDATDEAGMKRRVMQWFELGQASLIVTTRGAQGPIAWTRQGTCAACPPPIVSVVDTVGAGDSFMGALLDSLWARRIDSREQAQRLAALTDAELHRILEEASEVAGVTVSRAGANPPWKHELSR